MKHSIVKLGLPLLARSLPASRPVD